MRRLALSVFTACGLALLTACGSSGGYGFATTSGNSSIDNVVFTNGSAQSNNFFVTLGGEAPLQISALGQKGSGPFATVVPDATFTWSGRFVDPSIDSASVASYTTGAVPNASKPCPKVPATTPAVTIFQQDPTNLSKPPYAGYSPLPAGQPASTVFVGTVGTFTTSLPPVFVPVLPATGATGYCVVIVAKHVGDGVIGTKTVLVTTGQP